MVSDAERIREGERGRVGEIGVNPRLCNQYIISE